MQDEELVNSWSQGEQEWKKKCFALLKKTNIIPEVKHTKSLFCSNRCWCVPEDTAYSFAHRVSKKVGTSWRGQRGEPQECYLKCNFCREVGDNGIAKSREERAEDGHRAAPQLQGWQWQRGRKCLLWTDLALQVGKTLWHQDGWGCSRLFGEASESPLG